ncbi:hypothetical protein KQH90_12005 [Anaerosalibacter bizertensis]|uniref:hypothetical protein n=1 Tax=Anaerosalibacter bizertensis TaxID=932217 RepID=UPI001C0F1965|nr:hypothetical protein [Anaerosalibacter bizertensis]MBU5294751.1 hypothetical protein [Anaerosalibacter bizertensis]
MAFYNEKVSIVRDKLKNIYMFYWEEGKIIYNYFNNMNGEIIENKITTDALEEYDIAIGINGNIYLVYQNNYNHLFLATIFGEKIDSICLTVKPIPNVYNLTIALDEGEIHILYNILLEEKEYRLYHHHYDKYDWYTNIIDEIKISEVLNFFNIEYYQDGIILIYYDSSQVENIYMKKYNKKDKKWLDKLQITKNLEDKLYIDTLLYDDILHLTYSQYIEKNLAIKYERFKILEDRIVMEKEKIMSNTENCSYPTFTYFEDKLWLSWIEYDNVLSRYSEYEGESWSSIYLWNISKRSDIVRYKYCEYPFKGTKKNFNYYFGKIYPEISFIGFGPLVDVVEIPLKKKGLSMISQF